MVKKNCQEGKKPNTFLLEQIIACNSSEGKQLQKKNVSKIATADYLTSPIWILTSLWAKVYDLVEEQKNLGLKKTAYLYSVGLDHPFWIRQRNTWLRHCAVADWF